MPPMDDAAPLAPPLEERWPLPNGHELRGQLLAAYHHPSRGYHDSQHLTEVLDRLAELAASGEEFDQMPVLLAAWFHDGVYDGERDAEERSAVWAETALPGLVPVDVVAEAARLVRLTESHRPDDDDRNGCVLSDADLAILAAPAERYQQYVAGVRSEFAHLPDDEFAAGRGAVLRALLARPRLFATAYAQASWEQAARRNVERELASKAA